MRERSKIGVIALQRIRGFFEYVGNRGRKLVSGLGAFIDIGGREVLHLAHFRRKQAGEYRNGEGLTHGAPPSKRRHDSFRPERASGARDSP